MHDKQETFAQHATDIEHLRTATEPGALCSGYTAQKPQLFTYSSDSAVAQHANVIAPWHEMLLLTSRGH